MLNCTLPLIWYNDYHSPDDVAGTEYGECCGSYSTLHVSSFRIWCSSLCFLLNTGFTAFQFHCWMISLSHLMLVIMYCIYCFCAITGCHRKDIWPVKTNFQQTPKVFKGRPVGDPAELELGHWLLTRLGLVTDHNFWPGSNSGTQRNPWWTWKIGWLKEDKRAQIRKLT